MREMCVAFHSPTRAKHNESIGVRTPLKASHDCLKPDFGPCASLVIDNENSSKSELKGCDL